MSCTCCMSCVVLYMLLVHFKTQRAGGGHVDKTDYSYYIV